MPTTNCGAETAVNEQHHDQPGRPRCRAVVAATDAGGDADQRARPRWRRPSAAAWPAGASRISVADLGLLDVGAAEIALQQVAEIAEILLPERQIETELAADALDRLRRGAAPGDLPDRIGRHQVEQDVGDQRDAEQDEQRPGRAAWRGSAASVRAPAGSGRAHRCSASPTRLKDSASEQDRGAGEEDQPGGGARTRSGSRR